MLVKTAIFGELSIDPSTVITFVDGLPGFEASKRFKLFHQDGSDPVVYWLQSLDQPEVLFSVADPTLFGINFDFSLNDEEIALLGEGASEDMLVLILLYKDGSGGAEGSPVKGSIKSPLVVNTKTQKGLQKVLVDIEPTVTIKEKQSSIEFKAR